MSSIEIQHGRDAQKEARAARDRELCAPLDFKNREAVNERYNAIYNEYLGPIIIHLLRRGVDMETAEDLAQETLFKAYRKLPEFFASDDRKLGNWLYTISSNAANDDLRRLRRRVTSSPLLESFPSQYGVPEEHVQANASIEEALDAIRMLNPTLRRAAELRLIRELSYPEAGEILGQSPATTRVQGHRAIHALRKSLQDLAFT